MMVYVCQDAVLVGGVTVAGVIAMAWVELLNDV